MAAASGARLIPSVYCGILSKFPKSCSFSFAYGSAVKQQIGSKKSDQMIDLIIAADEPRQWHAENLKKNGDHYSFLKYLGEGPISAYQESLGARVYFNTLVPVDGALIKYGVVSKRDLIADLLGWEYLYLAGRLHKPVEVLVDGTDGRLRSALRANTAAAAHCALLLLPERFTEYRFYHAVSSLSYSGDFRMIFGENKNKVDNIVRPQILNFRRLYEKTLKDMKNLVHFTHDGECEQDVSPPSKHYHLSKLPSNPLRLIELHHHRFMSGEAKEAGDVLGHLSRHPDCSCVVKKALDSIVWQSSVGQSLKGILTAGIAKSVKYSARKIRKMF